MANKELKSIKFPGLVDTYTVNSMPDGASANQQLVTDKEGIAKWEEKPFYSTEILRVTSPMPDLPIVLYKVSSEVPDVGNLTAGDPVHLWEFYSGEIQDVPVFMIENGIYIVGQLYCVYVTEDNSSIDVNWAIFSFLERGVYFGVVEDAFKIIGASLANPDEPEISWDGNAGEIKTIDSKYLPDIPAEKLPEIPAEKLPDIPAEKLPEIPAEKLPDIPAEKLPEIHRIEKTFEGTFDQITEGRDTFKWNAYNYYKISEIIPRRSDVISFSGTRANGSVYSSITEGENCCEYGFFIVVYQPGTCKLNVTSTVAYSFTAQSAGLYACNTPNNFSQTAGTYRFDCLIYRHIIQSTITLKKYYLDVDGSGALITTEFV